MLVEFQTIVCWLSHLFLQITLDKFHEKFLPTHLCKALWKQNSINFMETLLCIKAKKQKPRSEECIWFSTFNTLQCIWRLQYMVSKITNRFNMSEIHSSTRSVTSYKWGRRMDVGVKLTETQNYTVQTKYLFLHSDIASFVPLLGWTGTVLHAVGALCPRCAALPGQGQEQCVCWRKSSSRKLWNEAHQWH